MAVIAFGAAAAEVRNVLVLYSNGCLVQGNIEIEQGLRSAMAPVAGQAVTVFSEFRDRPEFGGPAYEQTVTDYLRQKYADRPPDVVVAVAKESLDFILRHRAKLFVGVPVEYDPAGTLEQALRWHPNTRKLVFVTGATSRDREWEARFRSLAPRFEDRVKSEFLAGLATPALLERLAGLAADSLVFTAGYCQGDDELKFTPRDSAEAIARASAVPAYGTFSTFIGPGVVGVLSPSFEAMGRQAGQIVERLLGGAAPSSIALPELMPNELTLDWRQARRWSIDERQIPAGAVQQCKEPTFWQAYRNTAVVAMTVILLQAGLIAALFLERRRRRAAELAVRKQRSELAHVSRLAVAGELTASIAHEINQPLAAILTNADAAELLLDKGSDRRDELRRILIDIRRGDQRASDVIRRLRALLAKQAVERQPSDPTDSVDEAARLLATEARRCQVTLESWTAASAAPMRGDPVQIQQVLINLVLNAMDAVADMAGERRSIAMAVEAGPQGVAVVVRDRGHGIVAEHLPRLFDSFFSTKRRGMGLGLSIARTIVEAHGGRIRVVSEAGDGTAFHVEFPACDAAVPKSELATRPATETAP